MRGSNSWVYKFAILCKTLTINADILVDRTEFEFDQRNVITAMICNQNFVFPIGFPYFKFVYHFSACLQCDYYIVFKFQVIMALWSAKFLPRRRYIHQEKEGSLPYKARKLIELMRITKM